MSDLAGMRIEEKHTPIYLPIYLVENILVRLPAKSLLRLKAVSKEWTATISDPNFILNHLQQQSQKKLCSYINLGLHSLTRFAALENNDFQEFPPLEYPQPGLPDDGLKFLWCFCDGLYVVSSFNDSIHKHSYVVWNPSCRTHKELHYPYAMQDRFIYPKVIVGIWYNPVVKDYKVVFVEAEHYAVFSCRDNSWGEKRTNSVSLNDSISCVGVPYNESIYWLQNPSPNQSQTEIVCFDGRDEKFKILCTLDYADHRHCLFSSQNGLFLIRRPTVSSDVVIIKKVLPEWMEYKLQFSYFNLFKLLCFTQQDKLTLILQLFNCNDSDLCPYTENLFLL